jgi:ankyrin repeat protein
MHTQNRVKQAAVEKNWNLIVDGLNQAGISNKIKRLSPDGSCKGFTFGYPLHAVQGQRKEYVQVLQFVANLRGKKDVDKIIGQYQDAKARGGNFLVPIGQDYIPFDKVIAILEGVHFGQEDQKLSQIRAMWDKNYTFFCDKDELAGYLAGIKLKEGEIVFMDMLRHSFCMEKAASGYYLFEPNAIGDEAFDPEILKTDEELARQICSNQARYITSNNTLGFTMQFISYGSKSNRALDDAITDFGNDIEKYPDIKQHVNDYHQKRISRLDCALVIAEILQQEKNNNDKFLKFQTAIRNYLQSEQDFIDRQFSSFKEMISKKAYIWDVSLLALACKLNQVIFVKALIQAGADVNAKTNIQVTPLYIASYDGYFEIAKALIQARADINVNTVSQDTPLQVASQNGHIGIVKILIQAGADVNVKTVNQVTPLQIASQNGHIKIVKALIQAGADVNAKTDKQLTSIYAAICFGHCKIVKMLLDAGADKNNKVSDISYLELAEAMGNQEIIAMFKPASTSIFSFISAFFPPMEEKKTTVPGITFQNDNEFTEVLKLVKKYDYPC